ncbi:MAG: DNA alkylation repair protein [Verrucomicrobiales bacterium]|nr:DNA alkylation repair protein [Verrucomicrobiales bacterium]
MASTEPIPTACAVRRALRAVARPAKAAVLERFFKTGPGEYAEGDRFLGVTVPEQRRIARRFGELPMPATLELLASPIHEERLTALLVWVRQFERGDDSVRRTIHATYLDHTARVNNWDLVDLSAPSLVGAWLVERSRRPLQRLARSASLWERRIAIVATHAFIRRGEFADTLAIADRLIADREDLIHKAVGWMLREVGKRDRATLEAFLGPRCRRLPRTMLRYAIERFPEPRRQEFLRGHGDGIT